MSDTKKIPDDRFVIRPAVNAANKLAIDALADDITGWVIVQRERVQAEIAREKGGCYSFETREGKSFMPCLFCLDCALHSKTPGKNGKGAQNIKAVSGRYWCQACLPENRERTYYCPFRDDDMLPDNCQCFLPDCIDCVPTIRFT